MACWDPYIPGSVWSGSPCHITMGWIQHRPDRRALLTYSYLTQKYFKKYSYSRHILLDVSNLRLEFILTGRLPVMLSGYNAGCHAGVCSMVPRSGIQPLRKQHIFPSLLVNSFPDWDAVCSTSDRQGLHLQCFVCWALLSDACNPRLSWSSLADFPQI